MGSHKRLLIFLIISLAFHFIILFYSKPNLLLFSPIQNIKIKKKELTKVKLIEIKPKPKLKTKVQHKVKVKVKNKRLKKKNKPKQTLNSKPKLKHRAKQKFKSKTRKKVILTKRRKKVKLKNRGRASFHKKLKSIKRVKKMKKINLTPVQKLVEALKKREQEEKLREELKKEAAYFYANKLVSLVQKLWIFPKTIPDSQLPYLKIKVKLRVRKDGTIIGQPVIISKSNNKIFNESALRAVKKLYKYKIPLPDIIDDKYIDIILILTPPQK